MNEKKSSLRSVDVLDPKLRVFQFYGSAEVPDTRREITKREYLERVMPVYMSRGAPLIDTHSNKPFGKALAYHFVTIPDEQGNMVDAVKITGQCFDNYSSDDDVWEDIKSGNIAGFSWGGDYNRRGVTIDQDGNSVLPPVGIYEWSVVRGNDPVTGKPRKPAVSIAKLVAVSAAKSDDVDVVSAGKPFAGFENFSACVTANKDKNDPEAYCAAIMRDAEGVKYDYAERLKRYGDAPESVGWKSFDGQKKRFEQFASFVKEGKSVLDVGAGLGHFQEYLSASGKKGDYTGIEIEDGFVSSAKESGRNVVKADVMNYSSKHDYVFASGTFNTQGSPSLYDAIVKMDHLSNEGFGFNFLTEAKDVGLKSHDLSKVQETLKSIKCDNYCVMDGHVSGEKAVFVSKTKDRTYLGPGESAPEGADIQQGPHGGRFYESGTPPAPDKKPGEKPKDEKKPNSTANEINDALRDMFPEKEKPKDEAYHGHYPEKEEGRILEGLQDEQSNKEFVEYDKLDNRNLWNKYKETQRHSTRENDVAAMAVFKRVHDEDKDGTIRTAENTFTPPDVSKWKDGVDYDIEPLPTDLLHPNPKGAVLRDGKIIVNKDFWENATPEQRKMVLLHESYHEWLGKVLPNLGHDINEVLAAGKYQLPWTEREQIAKRMGERGATEKSAGFISADTPSEGKKSHSSQEGLGGNTMSIVTEAKSEAAKKVDPTEKKPEEEKKPEAETPVKKDETVMPPQENAPAAPTAPTADVNQQVAALTERMSMLEAKIAEIAKAVSAAPQEETPAMEGTKSAVKADMVSAKKFGGLSVTTPRVGTSPAEEMKMNTLDFAKNASWREIKEASRGAQRKMARTM